MASSELHQIIASNCMPVVTTTGMLVFYMTNIMCRQEKGNLCLFAKIVYTVVKSNKTFSLIFICFYK